MQHVAGATQGAGAGRKMSVKVPNEVCNYGFITVIVDPSRSELVGSVEDI